MDKSIFKLSDKHQAKKWTNQIVQIKLNSNKKNNKSNILLMICIVYNTKIEWKQLFYGKQKHLKPWKFKCFWANDASNISNIKSNPPIRSLLPTQLWKKKE